MSSDPGFGQSIFIRMRDVQRVGSDYFLSDEPLQIGCISKREGAKNEARGVKGRLLSHHNFRLPIVDFRLFDFDILKFSNSVNRKSTIENRKLTIPHSAYHDRATGFCRLVERF